MELSLEFNDNKTGHEDIILQFAGKTWICDSYYFALDGKLMPGREDAEKVRAVLRSLLEQWLFAIKNATDDSVAYLPYDFSDQYTAWLQCKFSGAEVDVCRGWSEIEGYSFYPSDVDKYLTELAGFRIDGDSIKMPVAELTDAINYSMRKIA